MCERATPYYIVKVLHCSETELCREPENFPVKKGDLVIIPTKYGKDLGQIKREALYFKQISEGYQFKTNTDQEEVRDIKEKYEAQGLEVFVGDVAFDVNGKPYNGGKAIFTRNKTQI